ncbi:MAG: ATP synthase F1 subunit epsilon [Oscillospiraceae bacterium]
MANEFKLEILTPEHQFFSGMVDALTFNAKDGEWTILKDHAPMVAVLSPGLVKFRKDGKWLEAVNSEGYMEVSPSGIILFAQTCEWPGELDVNHIHYQEEMALERLRQAKSISEYKANKIVLARAMARLRNTTKKINLD